MGIFLVKDEKMVEIINNYMNKYIITTFWALVINFLFIVSMFFVPAIRTLFQGSKAFLIPFIIFFLLGIALTIFTFKSKEGDPAVRERRGRLLKKFLLLTGISSAGMFVSIFLHNIIYGVFIHFFGADFWDRIGIGDEPVFFFIALILCPIGFLVGMVGSIVMFIKQRKNI